MTVWRERVQRGFEGMLALLMAVLVLDVLWQVISRYGLGRPSAWTDELATLLTIWVAAVGASVGFARGAHLGVDVLVARMPERARLWVDGLVHLLVAVFALGVLGWGGWALVSLTLLTDQVSPALGVKMGHVYLALPLSGLAIAGFALEGGWTRWRRTRRGAGAGEAAR
ncbi:MAG: TRAP transporter small permease [Verrucomicrobiae bacterium]|nr:TRAP transporter small permease [Verrucomicrobiae bacterium]